MSIPILHSSVAIIKLCEFGYSIGTAYFLKIFIGKNYSLSGKVIEALVKYFVKFKDEAKELPTLWHQTLLLFVSKYFCIIYITD